MINLLIAWYALGWFWMGLRFVDEAEESVPASACFLLAPLFTVVAPFYFLSKILAKIISKVSKKQSGEQYLWRKP